MWQLIAAGASLLGGVMEGQAQAEQLGRQAALDEFDARNTEEEAQATANRIMANAVAVKSEQIAQMAASGFVVGDGSAQAVIDETEKLARIDAMAAIYTGARQAAATRAGATARMSGANDAILTGALKGASGAIAHYGAYKASKG